MEGDVIIWNLVARRLEHTWLVSQVTIDLVSEDVFDVVLEVLVVVRWHINHGKLWLDLELNLLYRVCLEVLAVDERIGGFNGPRVLADSSENIEVIRVMERCLVVATELDRGLTICLWLKVK
jgi:hypothetical protein